jgi:probable F420-dependent oxidoreductase
MQYWLLYVGGEEHSGQALTIAKAAERMGFAGIAVADHVALPREFESVHPTGKRWVVHDTPFPDALITIAAMSGVTSSLKFMTYVYILPMREPFSVAKQAATLSILSDYRFHLGVGAGWHLEEIALLGHDPHTRGRRMDEMISIMRTLWERGEMKWNGEFFKFDSVGQYPMPQKKIPIWIGGKTDAALRRAARNDGWLGMNYPLDEVRSLLGKLRTERTQYLDRTGGPADRFSTFVIPAAEVSAATYRQLEDLGIDGTMAVLWGPNSAALDSVAAKLDSMQEFANRFI